MRRLKRDHSVAEELVPVRTIGGQPINHAMKTGLSRWRKFGSRLEDAPPVQQFVRSRREEAHSRALEAREWLPAP